MVKGFYIYGFIEPETKEIFYIGKGKNRRYKDVINRKYNLDLYNKLVKLQQKYTPEQYTVFLEENLSEEESFSKEKFYIKKYGRKDLGTGNLINKIAGGQGLDSEHARKLNYDKVKRGIHPFVGGALSRKNAIRRVKEGTHNFLGGECSRKINKKRVQNGTHHLLNHNGKYADKHPCIITCSDGRSWQFESTAEGIRQGFSAWLFEVLRNKNPYTVSKKTITKGKTKYSFKKGDVLTYKILK